MTNVPFINKITNELSKRKLKSDVVANAILDIAVGNDRLDDLIANGVTQSDLESLTIGGLTTEQTEALEQAHLSKDAIEKIEGLQCDAEDINALVEDSYEVVSEIIKVGNTDSTLGTSSVFTGFRFPVVYSGESFDTIGNMFLSPVTSTDMIIEVYINPTEGKADIPIASATIFVESGGVVVDVLLDKLLTSDDITAPLLWIGFRTSNANQILTNNGNCTLAADYPAANTYNQAYYSTSSTSLNWKTATNGGNKSYTTQFNLVNSQIKKLKADTNATNLEKINTDLSYLLSAEIIPYPAIYDCENIECMIYNQNFSFSDSIYSVDYASTYTIGKQQEERWSKINKSLSLVENVKGYPMSASFYTKETNNLIGSHSFTHHVVKSTVGAGLTPKVLLIGDSTLATGVYSQRLLDIATTDAMKIQLIGTQGVSPNLREGYGGKTAIWFATDALSPFVVDNVLNFSAYLSNNSLATPDVIYITLGINDLFSATSDTEAETRSAISITNINLLIANIHAHSASIKIVINTVTMPSSSQDAFGSNYNLSQNRRQYKRNICIHNINLIATYDKRSAEKIYLNSGTSLQLDTDIGYSFNEELISEHSTVKKSRKNNGVHPSDVGYKMIGDAIWSHLKWMNK